MSTKNTKRKSSVINFCISLKWKFDTISLTLTLCWIAEKSYTSEKFIPTVKMREFAFSNSLVIQTWCNSQFREKMSGSCMRHRCFRLWRDTESKCCINVKCSHRPFLYGMCLIITRHRTYTRRNTSLEVHKMHALKWRKKTHGVNEWEREKETMNKSWWMDYIESLPNVSRQ